MKKILILVLVLINIFNLSGCDIVLPYEKEYDPHYIDPKRERVFNEETLKEILECFDNKDADTLLDMFSEAAKSKSDLPALIEQAFEIYGGKSVSYERFQDFGYTTMATDENGCIEKSIGAEMRNINTDDGNVFIIGFTKCVVDERNPSRLGITEICLQNSEHKILLTIV